MKKKALLVAVDDYQTFATRLRAPVREASRWSAMLQSSLYGFAARDIVTLTDGRATRPAVLDALEELLSGAAAGDQLVFGAFCHGTIAFGWQTPTRTVTRPEHSLVMFPDGDSDLQNAVITDSDFARILRETKPPLGTDIAFVIESCFAGALEVPAAAMARRRDPREPTPLFAPSPIGIQSIHDVVQLGAFASQRPTSAIERPVVLAASGANEYAYQILDANREPRLLFSLKALSRLSAARETFSDLVTALNPLDHGLPQTATLTGNPDRTGENFPGNTPGGSDETKTSDRDKRRSANNSETVTFVGGPAEPKIDIRVLGQCCFVTAQNPASDGYQQRLVMPYDYIGTGTMHHFPFIEIASDDLESYSGAAPSQVYRRVNGASVSVEYSRWDLNGHRISITNGIAANPMTKSAAFTRHVPRMRVVEPRLSPQPRSECFASLPDPALFGAFFDIPSGAATVDKLDEGFTTYQRPFGPVTFGPVRTPKTVLVSEVPFSGATATLTLTSLVAGSPAVTTINVRPGSSIFTGNAREEDITGSGSLDTPAQEFLIMYSLSDFMPPDASVPVEPLVPVDSCTPTDWP